MSAVIPQKTISDLVEYPSGVVGRLYEISGRYEEMPPEELPNEVAGRLLALRDEADVVLAKHFGADTTDGAIALVNRIYRGRERISLTLRVTPDQVGQGEHLIVLPERLRRHEVVSAAARLRARLARSTGGERR